MSKKKEQTVQQPAEKDLEKTSAQIEVLELDESTLDIVSGGGKPPDFENYNNCTINAKCVDGE